MTTANKAAPVDMLHWQIQEIIWELGELQRHGSDPNCPCNLADSGEYCLPKHALALHGLARETIPMTSDNKVKEMLEQMQAEALDFHVALKDRIVCSNPHKDEGDVVEWARSWRKKFEGIYYICQIGKAKMHQEPQHQPKVSISGRCGSTVESCTFTIRRKGKPHLITKEVETAKVTTCKATSVKDLVKQSKELLAGNKCSLRQATVKLNSCLAGGVSNIGSCRTEATMGTIVRPNELFTAETLQMKLEQDPTVKISGTCTMAGCSLKVRGAVETLEATDAPGLSSAINTVIHHFDTRAKAKPSTRTFAPGISTTNRYEFEFKVVEAGNLIVSHDPFTFALNPKYTAKIQPRIRERLANQLQVKKIAAHLDPEKLLLDTKAIDTGSPIIGPDNIVECGNGRVMALMLAAKEHPANIELYRQALKRVALDYGLPVAPIDKMKLPVLVRIRLTPVDRQAFAEECNARPTIETSAIEKARTDADKITPSMLQGLDILEGEPIERALRSERNKPFVSAYLSKVPENEQAGLIDARGYLSSDGIRRMVMGIFTATFKGDTGLMLASKFFEAIDETGVKNAFNGILRSLGPMAQAENLVASGQREPGLTFGEDLAKAITVFSNIRGADMSVANYLSQSQMLERQLTTFQEQVLKVLDEHTRSAKRIGAILSYYAQAVIDSTPPGQAQMIPGPKPDKALLFAAAVKRVVAEAESERIERESKKRIPEAAMSCGPVCLLAQYTVIKQKLRKCNLSEEDFNLAMNYRPLRNLIATALGWKGTTVELCNAGMVPGVYQVTLDGLSINNGEKIMKLVMKTKGMKQVYTKVPGQRVYEIVVPETKEAKDLTWTPQEISHVPARSEGAQAAMFRCGGKPMENHADMQDPLLAEIATQICATGACLMAPKGKLPVCSASEKKKLESCIMSVKERNVESGCKPEGTGSKKCPSPFAVCRASIGCRFGSGKKGTIAEGVH